MFENLNPLDRSTAFLEIGIMLLGAALIGFLTAWLIQAARRKREAESWPEDQTPALRKANDALQSSRARIAEYEEYIRGVEEQVDTLQKTIDEKNEQRASKADLERLQRKLDEAVAARMRIQQEYDQYKESTESAGESRKDDPRIDQLQKEVAALTAQKSELQAQLNAAEAAREDTGRIDQLQKELAQLRAQNQELKAKPASQAGEGDASLRRDLKQKQIKLVQREADLASTQQKLVRAEKALVAAEEALATAQKAPLQAPTAGDAQETEWLRKEKEDQEAEIAELEESIHGLEKDNARLRAQVRDRTGGQAGKQIQELTQERDALRKELAALRKAVASTQSTKLPKGVPNESPSSPVRPDFSHLGKVKAGQEDDLTQINGIGPVVASKLNGLGIYTLKQVSKLSAADMERIDVALALFPGRVKREKWVKQAKKIIKAK
ncbi:MAG: hypothetical protein AAGN35_18685 [Bacteroidota bacterium]